MKTKLVIFLYQKITNRSFLELFENVTVVWFLSRVSRLTRDIDIVILSVRPSARLSVRPKRSGIE